jgi:integrase
MVSTARGRSPDVTRHTATALRSLLRFLHVNGLICGPLAQAVPAVARRGRAHPGKAADAAAVAAMLAACDRGTIAGRRDYAIITVLARLGLRAGEVAGLRLDDLDWHAGQIAVRGKGGSRDLLPLTADAGAAIAGYLQSGRPRDALDRHVFIRLTAPRRGLTSGAVKYVVTAAAERSGAGPLTPHRLRHTAATATLAAGATLAEVSQVLRHRREQTTAIYATIGAEALRPLARRWPGNAGNAGRAGGAA